MVRNIKTMCMYKHYMQLVNNINLLLNSIIPSVSRICKRLPEKQKIGVESYKKLFTKVVHMMQKLKNNLAEFSHPLKDILKNDKRLGFIYKS